jgi:hypothetical protein
MMTANQQGDLHGLRALVTGNNGDGSQDAEIAQIPESHAKESPKVTLIN